MRVMRIALGPSLPEPWGNISCLDFRLPPPACLQPLQMAITSASRRRTITGARIRHSPCISGKKAPREILYSH